MSAGLRLKIDLDSLAGNWKRLDRLSGQAECAAAVKANAYGLGLEKAVPVLHAAGCRTYFVALPAEGIIVRQLLPDADIYVLNGFFGDRSVYRKHGLRPVLGNPGELRNWTEWRAGDIAALHIDTGMNRLGLSDTEAAAIKDADLKAAGIVHLMSHLACADTPGHRLNRLQLDRFNAHRNRLSPPQCSFANSAGIHAGPACHFDMVRPGIALYGGNSHPDAVSDPVVTAEARILQIRIANAGESVGYGAAQVMSEDRRLAVISAGYGDGYLRAAGSRDGAEGASVSIAGHVAPLIGRVSMDLMTADVTGIPEPVLAKAEWAELFGRTIDINDVAARAGTIAYELLTGLSPRAERIYGGVAT